MATDQTALPMNGNYVSGQAQTYDVALQNTTAHSNNNSVSVSADFSGDQTEQPSANDLSKDEVGWYFVEQYYTTMSKNPEKLYLFYNKRSQFISGSEAERMDVCIGQKAINDRIKDLDIQECKVRVTNVDVQGSSQNIVIQVIGEMSTKKQPQNKFTQTFVLAEQVNGYFVLNDIFRYIFNDEEEFEGEALERQQNEAATGYQEPVSTANVGPEPHTLTNSKDPSAREHDAQLVDQSLQAAAEQEASNVPESPPAGAVNGESIPPPAEVQPAEDTTAAATEVESASVTDPTSTEAPEAVPEEEVKQPEKPAAPEPTPVPSPPKQRPAQPAPVSQPAVPKTWATMAAAANKGPSAVANPAPAPSASATTPKATSNQAAQAQTPPNNAGTDQGQSATPPSSGSEWQTAARDHGKKQSRPQSGAPAENTRSYMKNVGENITHDMIRDTLSKYGELEYHDINRQKNCAFADFVSPAGYQAAVAANPHIINGERIIVEERRVRPNSFGAFPNQRGGIGARGRGSVDNRGGASGGGRGGFQKDGGRGSFGNRGRGNAPRGRGVSQAA